ncbi:MAG: nitronate monooxygenase [Deltaproteobacteria bacterium]|nr:nitronate monooxygenase [Deltaproteobacteria bacterium]
MRTSFTELLGIEYPLIQGAMQWLARAPLAGAVSQAGGLGVINAKSFAHPDDLRREIAAVRQITGRPFAVNISMLPELAGPDPVEGWVAACVAEAVPVVETAGRKPPAGLVETLHAAGVKLLHKVAGVRYAVSAARAGADAVTVVGFECGGHPGADEVTTLVLIPATRAQVSLPLIAGGGIADGRGLAAALALGADAAVLGTRFLLAEEVDLPLALRRRLLAADERATTIIMRSLHNNARVLANRTARQVQELEASGAPFPELRPYISGQRALAALQAGDTEGGVLAVGQAVGLIDQVLPAAEIVRRTVAEAREAAARLGEIFAPGAGA